MKPDDEKPSGQEPVGERPKKKYETPELIVHGSVEKITEATNRGPNDDGNIFSNNRYSP
jgi:hypothetical protein